MQRLYHTATAAFVQPMALAFSHGTAIPFVAKEYPEKQIQTNLIYIPTDGLVYPYATFKDDILVKTHHLLNDCVLFQEHARMKMINAGIRNFTGHNVYGDIYILFQEEEDANHLVSGLRLARSNQWQHDWLKHHIQRILHRMETPNTPKGM